MSAKYIFFAVASIIKLFIIILLTSNSNADNENIKYYSEDKGTIAIMYHRFNENKYPSTNVKMDIFKNQIEIIRGKGLNFYNPLDFKDEFAKPKNEKK